MDIRKLDIVYLHGTHRPERKKHIQNVLVNNNLEGMCVEGFTDKGKMNAVYAIIKLLEEKLSKEFKPFIFLEDDCNVTPWFRNVIQIPDDSDAVWIGLSVYSLHPEIDRAIPYIQATEVPNFPEVVKIVNMLGTHAMLFISKRWTENFLECCKLTLEHNQDGPDPNYDWFPARSMKNFNVYALKQPLFFQDSKVGGQEEATLFQIKA